MRGVCVLESDRQRGCVCVIEGERISAFRFRNSLFSILFLSLFVDFSVSLIHKDTHPNKHTPLHSKSNTASTNTLSCNVSYNKKCVCCLLRVFNSIPTFFFRLAADGDYIASPSVGGICVCESVLESSIPNALTSKHVNGERKRERENIR